MTPEEIRAVKHAVAQIMDDPEFDIKQISAAHISATLEVAAQLAELNAKTPSIRMQIAMAAMQGIIVSEGLESCYQGDSLGIADALIAAEKGGE